MKYKKYLRAKIRIPRTTLLRWRNQRRFINVVQQLLQYEASSPQNSFNNEKGTSCTVTSILYNESNDNDKVECDLPSPNYCTSRSSSCSSLNSNLNDNILDYLDHEGENEFDTSEFGLQINDEEDLLSKKLYENSDISVGQAVHYILTFFLENSLTKKSLGELLKLSNLLLPKPNLLPKTKYFLDKILNKIIKSDVETVKQHRMCEMCSYYIGDWLSTSDLKICKNCNCSEINGLFVKYNVEKWLKDAFETRNLANLIDTYNASSVNQESDFITDIVSGAEYKKIKKIVNSDYVVFFLWNTDGVPVSKSSNGQIWTIQVQIINIPPINRRNYQFVTGVYYSREKKPLMNTFLTPFVEKMKYLFTNGFDWHNDRNNTVVHSVAVAPIATLDCPARAAVQNIMLYNGKFGCSYCEHPGETCSTGSGHNRVYQLLNYEPPLRTMDRMEIQALLAFRKNEPSIKGVKGPSIVALMPFFNLSTSLVPDYMHAILLGVMRMLLMLWFDTKNHDAPYYIKPHFKKEIDNFLNQIEPPDYITRIPRPLKTIKYWKASELRNFLILYGPIVLKSRLKNKFYNHFLLLAYATKILLQSRITDRQIDLAESLLFLFVADVKKLYGLHKCSYNVHQLLHMALFVKLWGPLWSWSVLNSNLVLKMEMDIS